MSISLDHRIDFNQPIKVYYELHPDGNVRNFVVQVIDK